ncbi:putative ribonuclease H-like domain-containing protein [Tanacetum coccineum]|uniref:Ribonuclease H-like domain-containing protein n=1 Tax=Tanacetum coccineum TaxID=301880 RepID=A0ABQ5HHF3_9ASTR
MRVFNKRTQIVEETLNIRFLKNTPNVKGNGPDWLFDVDSLTISMTYVPVVTENQTNGIVGNKDNIVAGQAEKKKAWFKNAFCHPLRLKNSEENARKKPTKVDESGVLDSDGQDDQATRSENAFTLPHVPNVSSMDNTGIFGNAYDDEDVEEEVVMNNVNSSYSVPDAPFTKFHKDHPRNQVFGKPKKSVQALKYPSWVEAMQDDLLQFKLLKVWTLVDLPRDKWAIGTKWVFRNNKDERGIVVKNKARLVAHGHTQEEEEEVYVCQPLGFEDPNFLDKVYKVEKALYGLHQAPRAWYETLSTYLLDNGFHRGQIDKTLFIKRHKDDILLVQVQQKSDGIFISQDKYVAEILKKFDFANVKTASTPMEFNKALIKDEEAEDIDVHLYRLMIGSLMYLIASRPDITFVVCTCGRFQVTPKTSHLHAVKKIFRYLKGQPKLGLWYPGDLPFDLEAFSDSDYARASLDRKFTTGDCLISKVWIKARLRVLKYIKLYLKWNGTAIVDELKVSAASQELVLSAKYYCCHAKVSAVGLAYYCHSINAIKQIWVKGQENPMIPNTHSYLVVDPGAKKPWETYMLKLVKINGMELKFLLLLQVNAVKQRLNAVVAS